MQLPTNFTNNEFIISAYYKSFLQALDESSHTVTDWEAGFINSCLLRRECYSEKQIAVIRRLMDRFPKCYPQMEHYRNEVMAKKYIQRG